MEKTYTNNNIQNTKYKENIGHMWFFGGDKSPEGTKTSNPAPSPVGPPAAVPINKGSQGVPPSAVNVDPAGYFSRYGYPIPISDLETRQEFVSCYNRALRNPNWVIEHITTQSTSAKNGGDRSNSIFKEDTAIPALFRGHLADYFRSGYDRGHQAPAADARFSQQAMDETFYLTNMAPQVGDGFNRDYWAHFERFVRDLTKTYSSVRVVTGPLYLPKRDPTSGKMVVKYEVIGNPPNIAVPTHFFKILIGENPIIPSLPRNGVAVGAFVLPNEAIPNSTPLTSFAVPVNAIERAVGAEFMPKLLPNQRRELCREISCEVSIREFNNQVKQLSPPRK